MQKINRSKELQLLYILCQMAIAHSSQIQGKLPGDKIKRLLQSDYWKQSSTDEKLDLLKQQYEVNFAFTSMIKNKLDTSCEIKIAS